MWVLYNFNILLLTEKKIGHIKGTEAIVMFETLA